MLAGIAAIALLAVWLLGKLPGLDNPFRTETVDRSAPVLLRSIEDIGEYHAATAHFEQIVDVEKDTRHVPSFLRGERVLFVAVGTVDAGVDFRRVDDDAITVSDGRAAVDVELPPVRLFDARVDPRRSYVYDRDRGIVDRIAQLVGDDENDERELYLLAEQRLAQAARTDSGLLARAERNTRAMLESMLRALGFQRIAVRFAPPSS